MSKSLLIQFINSCDDAILLLKKETITKEDLYIKDPTKESIYVKDSITDIKDTEDLLDIKDIGVKEDFYIKDEDIDMNNQHLKSIDINNQYLNNIDINNQYPKDSNKYPKNMDPSTKDIDVNNLDRIYRYKVVYTNPVYKSNFLNSFNQKLNTSFNPFIFSTSDTESLNKLALSTINRHIIHMEMNIDIDIKRKENKEITKDKDVRNKHKESKSKRVVYIHGYPINSLYYVYRFRDITEQYLIRSEIEKNRKLLEGVFENSFSALCIISFDGKIIKFNRRFYSHLLTNYEFNFTNVTKGYIYELPCFNNEEKDLLKTFLSSTKERGCRVGNFYLTPYISESSSYILTELRTFDVMKNEKDMKNDKNEKDMKNDKDDKDIRETDYRRKEADYREKDKLMSNCLTKDEFKMLGRMRDDQYQGLVGNLESDVIRLQQSVFEGPESVMVRLNSLGRDIQGLNDKLASIESSLSPLNDFFGFVNTLRSLDWKWVGGVLLVGSIAISQIVQIEFVRDMLFRILYTNETIEIEIGE